MEGADMKLTDILPLEKWVELENDIHNRYGMDVNVFNTDGVRISEFKQWVNKLCPAVKATDKGQSFICAVAHMNIASQANRPGSQWLRNAMPGWSSRRLCFLTIPLLAPLAPAAFYWTMAKRIHF